MCKKIFAAVFLVLLVCLPVSAAWLPFNLGKDAQSQDESQVTIQSLRALVKELQVELDGSKQKLSNSEDSLQTALQVNEKQKAELTALKSLHEASTASYETLKAEYDALVAKSNDAIGIGMLFGLGASWDLADDRLGATAEAGLTFGRSAFIVGADWHPPTFSFELPSLDDITVKAGFQYRL